MIKIFQTFKNSGCNARTLDQSVVSEVSGRTGESVRTHENGWTVSGVVKEDYYYWVNEFKASHPVHGTVKGNFEYVVYASSKKAYQMFIEAFEVVECDYGDT